MHKPFTNGGRHAVSLFIGGIDTIALLCRRVGVLEA